MLKSLCLLVWKEILRRLSYSSFSKNMIFQSVLIMKWLFFWTLRLHQNYGPRTCFRVKSPQEIRVTGLDRSLAQWLNKLVLRSCKNSTRIRVPQMHAIIWDFPTDFPYMSGSGGWSRLFQNRPAFQIWQSVLDLELISSDSPDCLESTWKLGVTHWAD